MEITEQRSKNTPSNRRTSTSPYRKAPYLDTLTIKADQHTTHPHLSNSAQLLLQPTVIPDLSHTGLQIALEGNDSPMIDSSPLFYPNGGKSATLNHTIRTQLRKHLNETSKLKTEDFQRPLDWSRRKKKSLDSKQRKEAKMPPTLIHPSSRAGRSHEADSLSLIKAVRSSSRQMDTVIKNRQAIIAHAHVAAAASAVK